MKMDFHKLLYSISEDLDTDELSALKFLCLELIPPKKQEGIRDVKDLFQKLQEKELLEDNNLSFLKELLFRIKRNDLLIRKLSISREEMKRTLQVPGMAKISPYRNLLLQLAEDMTKEEISDFKFCLGKKLPKSILENEDTTMLEIFIAMEKKAILGEDTLDTLKELCGRINKELLKRIEKYQLNKRASVEMVTLPENLNSTVQTGVYPISPGSSMQCSIPDACVGSDEGILSPETASPTMCDFPASQEEQLQNNSVYKMNSRPRGICLIINNHNFEKARLEIPKLQNLRNRNGTDIDAEDLRSVFTMLHFKPEVHQDLTAQGILKTLNKYSTRNHQASDCFVCCILSHGDKGVIFGTDGQEVPIPKLTTFFSSSNCPSLAGKPKVFIIQACQGVSFQKAVNVEPDCRSSLAQCEVDSNSRGECIPEEADILLGMATVTDYVSYRSPNQGTWYIQSLCSHLRESCPRGEDLLTILTRVNHEVSRKIDNRNQGKQMPQPSFTLRKRLVFPVN
ncbi:caspase-8 isoform X2 [Rhinatrema bivittatum]|uniref:caspase-8 isoform X2 n=1 Tax=Rhinatrema bivittatum TaxID=194408 RepID=UPI001126D2C4|nr:caspase-8 isoform X2 [Rhinatrema bivittatum]